MLSWTPPPNASRSGSSASSGSAPIGPNDGTPVEALRDQAHDRGLEDDRVYHYGIFALYRTADGRLIASRGAYIVGHAVAAGRDVLEPSLSRPGTGRSDLVAAAGSRRRSRSSDRSGRSPIRPATGSSRRRPTRWTGDWLPRASGNGHARRDPPAVGICLLHADDRLGGLLTVGQTAVFGRARPDGPPRGPIGQGRQVYLRWTAGTRRGEDPRPLQARVVPARSGRPRRRSPRPCRREGYTRHGLDPADPARRRGRAVARRGLLASRCATAARSSRRGSSRRPGRSCRGRIPRSPSRTTAAARLLRPELVGGLPHRPARRRRSRRRPWSPTRGPCPLSVDDGEIVAHFPAARDGETFPIRAEDRPPRPPLPGLRRSPGPIPTACRRSASATPRRKGRGFRADWQSRSLRETASCDDRSADRFSPVGHSARMNRIDGLVLRARDSTARRGADPLARRAIQDGRDESIQPRRRRRVREREPQHGDGPARPVATRCCTTSSR